MVRRIRGRHLFVIDVLGILGAACLALTLPADGDIEWPRIAAMSSVIGLVVIARLTANIGFGLYGQDWRFASVPDLERILLAVITGSGLILAAYVITAMTPGFTGVVHPVGQTFWVLEFLLSLTVIAGDRFAIRVAIDLARPRTAAVNPRAALLYGAGQTGALVARWASRNPGAVIPVGFLDDDPRAQGTTIAGLKVHGGIDVLPEAVADTGARAVIITMPSADGAAVRRVVDAAHKLDLDVQTVPSMSDLLDGSVDLRQVRHVRVEDLLRRPIVTEHAEGVEQIIRGRTILVTGAAGSIGSELARQVHAIGPRRLVLVDRAESSLYLLQRELEARAERGRGGGDLVVKLGNVVSQTAMTRLFERERPDIVFHAAAYKHVPMLERHPSDAVQVNIAGTLTLLEAAEAAEVEHFVFVSTDKAVEPANAMGASKRIAEMLVAQAARRTSRRYVSVRFGNVLGSAGSVVPIFQSQLERDEPLTVTHPDMTRYFMTIPEAAWLILDAASQGRPGGDLFVLEMGDPVRVLDLAKDLIRLAGRDPETEPIQFMGLRAGEKLHEELYYSTERVERTASPKVLRVSPEPAPTTLGEGVEQLIHIADGEHEELLRARLLMLAATGMRVDDEAGTVADGGRLVAFPVDRGSGSGAVPAAAAASDWGFPAEG